MLIFSSVCSFTSSKNVIVKKLCLTINYHLKDIFKFQIVSTIFLLIISSFHLYQRAAYEGKTQLTRIWVVKPDFVNNWNEITEAHTKWTAETHYGEGDKKLHFLNWSTAPEIKDDKETGNTMFD